VKVTRAVAPAVGVASTVGARVLAAPLESTETTRKL
jgi:hypothetical protein